MNPRVSWRMLLSFGVTPIFLFPVFVLFLSLKIRGLLVKVESLNLLSLFLNSGFFCLTILRAGIICVTYHHS